MNLPAPWRPLLADVSHHQPRVDFRLVRDAGVLAIVHKATQGVSFVDDRYKPRRELARSVGLLYGGYHFGTSHDVDGQVAHFLAQLDDDDLAVLDVERDPARPTSMTLAAAEAFVARVAEARGGRWPVVYGGGDYLRDVLKPGADSPLARCALWWARYSATPGTRFPRPWRAPTLWQYTEGKVGPEPRSLPGVGPCDRDAFAGSDEELRALWKRPGCA